MNRSRQAWIRSVIFVGLYLILLLSFTQCALVLYLYGTAQVDGLMMPSLIIGLIAVSPPPFLPSHLQMDCCLCFVDIVIPISPLRGRPYHPLMAVPASSRIEHAAQCATHGIFTSPSHHGSYVARSISCGFGGCL